MPVYLLLTKQSYTKAQKQQITNTISDTHCEVTNAPSQFVTVIFGQGYGLKNAKAITILANIRIGGNRTQARVKQLGEALIANVAAISGINKRKINLDFLGVKANWIFEGGDVLPDPGSETAWLNNQKQRLEK